MEHCRFVVGIDLGTTNCAVAFVDTQQLVWQVQTFEIPQLVSPGEVEACEVLPSFLYQPAPGEFAPDQIRLPWLKEPEYLVGHFAQRHGCLVPGRLISSAKSWLCHTGVDRSAPLLPWHAPPEVRRLSPVDASAQYLAHIRDAWNWRFPEFPLENEQVVLTLPASFDEIARELTLRAADRAGLKNVELLEEPQAAFYAWIYRHQTTWQGLVQPGQMILVCDIGGGTTDFTLIQVRATKAGLPEFHRVAVGDHLILGGDNLDLALAWHIERTLEGSGRLPARDWAILVNLCRQWKEILLSEEAPRELTVHLPGSGSRLIGGGRQVLLNKKQVETLLVDGFFPRVSLDAEPVRTASGFREFGLPYAPDPAVTKYLAAFLRAHRDAVELSRCESTQPSAAVRPDVILFNGGVFSAEILRRRILEAMSDWFSTESPGGWKPQLLAGDRLELAVARGAAYYGMVRRGKGVRIAAGLPRAYYLGVECGSPPAGAAEDQALGDESAVQSDQPQKAVCVLAAGVEPGESHTVQEPQFELLLSQPVEFPLYVSTTRLTDRPGTLVPIQPEQLTLLGSLRTVLKTRKKDLARSIPVTLHARLTEIGTLDLWCAQRDGKQRWKLQFDVRRKTRVEMPTAAPQITLMSTLEEKDWEACQQVVANTFGPMGTAPPENLARRLGEILGVDRQQWPAPLLRRLWECLHEFEAGRRKSPLHEARWLNLVGFALRPGYGLPLDDWRVEETWRLLQGKLVHAVPLCRVEWFILWRRTAGGLTPGWQQALAEPLIATLRPLSRHITTGGHGKLPFGTHEVAEVWRLLGALEWLPLGTKAELGTIAIQLLTKPKTSAQRAAILWALARLGARELTYGPLNCVVPPEVAAQWLEPLLGERTAEPMLRLAVMQLARKTEDRYRDIPEKLRKKVLEWLTVTGAPEHYVQLVAEGGKLDREEEETLFGEQLPVGLKLV